MGLWPFGKQVHELSQELRRELLNTFSIASEDAATMRYVSKRGRLGTGNVNRVFIFNPAMLSQLELASANYESLTTLKKGLLFTGHIMTGQPTSKANLVVLSDKRALSISVPCKDIKSRCCDPSLKAKHHETNRHSILGRSWLGAKRLQVT